MMEDLWNNYPQNLLDQAAQRMTEAEQALLSKQPCVEDPYKLPLRVLIQKWWERHFKDRYG